MRSILNLASGLGLEVVAKGIETAGQFEALRELEYPLIQRYWTGRPMPMAAIRPLVVAPTNSKGVRQDSEETREWIQTS